MESEFLELVRKRDIFVRERDVKEIVEGGENRFTHRLPDRPKNGNLVLNRGMVTNSKLVKWFQDAIENFQITRTDVTVVLLNENSEPLSSWVFEGAWPVSWEVTGMNALEGSIMVEKLELAYQRFRRL